MADGRAKFQREEFAGCVRQVLYVDGRSPGMVITAAEGTAGAVADGWMAVAGDAGRPVQVSKVCALEQAQEALVTAAAVLPAPTG